jgi:hypothetical protein
MAVGHGQYGFRSDIRIFTQLQDQSACRSDAFVEIDAGAIINDTWSPTGKAAGYEYVWQQDFDGEVLDVIAVEMAGLPPFSRVETSTQMAATESTFQYDLEEGVLRLHLPGDADPTSTSVLVITTFRNGTAATDPEHLMQPYVGNDLLLDGDMATSGLPDWTQSTTGAGWTIARASATVLSSGFEALLNATGAASGQATMYQAPDTIVGGRYRYFGYYRTPVTQPATAHAYIRVGTTTTLSDDGRSNETTLTDGLELTPTFGRTRAFLFDYISHEADPRVALRLVNGSASACSLRVARARLRPIHGWSLFHPRVAAGGVPESEQGSSDVYNGSATIASGSVTLMNSDAAVLERLFSPNPWSFKGREVRIRYGGAFMDNGQEIVWDDMFLGQSGVMAGDEDFLDLTDEQAVLSFEADSNLLETILPSSDYESYWPSVEERDRARPRAMVWGAHTHIRPAGVEIDGTTGLRTYEVNDPAYAVGDAMAGLVVYAFTDEDAAEVNDTSKRLTLVDGTDYSKDVAQGTFELTKNPGVFVVSGGEGPDGKGANDRIDFMANGGPFEAQLTHGLYTSATLAAHVEARMEAVSAASFTVTYSNTTHKFTLVWAGAGTFQLLADTGANNQRSALNMLGFTSSDNYTGSLTYTSDVAVFTDPDTQNLIRCDIDAGYHDDPDGTYTGTPDAAIALHADFVRHLAGKVLNRPSKIDPVSFDLGRTVSPQEIAVYLGVLASVADSRGGSMTVQEIIDRVEYGGSGAVLGGINPQGLADIRITGEGVWQYGTRGNGFGSGTIVSLYDYDYMAWGSGLNGGEPSGIIRVNWGQDPSTGRVRTKTLENADTILRDGVRQKRDPFDTFLVDGTDAQAAATALGAIARAAIRHFRFTVVGKLLSANPGDIVTLYRRRGLQGAGEVSGELVAVQARIVWIKKNYLTRAVDVIAHTNIVE